MYTTQNTSEIIKEQYVEIWSSSDYISGHNSANCKVFLKQTGPDKLCMNIDNMICF